MTSKKAQNDARYAPHLEAIWASRLRQLTAKKDIQESVKLYEQKLIESINEDLYRDIARAVAARVPKTRIQESIGTKDYRTAVSIINKALERFPIEDIVAENVLSLSRDFDGWVMFKIVETDPHTDWRVRVTKLQGLDVPENLQLLDLNRGWMKNEEQLFTSDEYNTRDWINENNLTKWVDNRVAFIDYAKLEVFRYWESSQDLII